jgi:hypothetical protein
LASSPLTSPTIPPMATARNTTILFLTLFIARSFKIDQGYFYKTIFFSQKLYQTLKKACPFRGIFINIRLWLINSAFDGPIRRITASPENIFYKILICSFCEASILEKLSGIRK